MARTSYKKGYQYCNERILSVSVGTLASATAAVLGAAPYDGMDQSFLAKKGRIDLTYIITDSAGNDVLAATSGIMIGLAQGNLSVAEIGEAISAALSAPEDPAEAEDFVKVQNWIVNKSLCLMNPDSLLTDGSSINYANGHLRHEFDLGKGILFSENVGWQWFIYNMTSAAWSVTNNVSGLLTVEGVFLND